MMCVCVCVMVMVRMVGCIMRLTEHTRDCLYGMMEEAEDTETERRR